jgi:predicted GTPase
MILPGQAERVSPKAIRSRIVIMGAAGRDFHNFNLVYRNNPQVEVVAFTAAQIGGISDRRYPDSLAGSLYPDGIEIFDESELESLCREHRINQVVFAYSDVPHSQVMHLASKVLATGADFLILGPERTMIKASVPVIAMEAVGFRWRSPQAVGFVGWKRLLTRIWQQPCWRSPLTRMHSCY